MEKVLTVNIEGDIGSYSCSLQSVRNQIGSNPSPLEIVIYSGGGNLFEGLAIYNYLKRLPNKKRVIVDGIAGSIASIIMLAGDEVVVSEGSVVFIHNAWTASMGDAKDLKKTSEELDLLTTQLVNIYLSKCNGKISEEQLREMMSKETFLDGQQALEIGLVDSVEGVSKRNVAAETPKGVYEDYMYRQKVLNRIKSVIEGEQKLKSIDKLIKKIKN
jgi:ATP-dependent Clp protease protease subunit